MSETNNSGDFLRDIVAHVKPLGFFDIARLEGKEDGELEVICTSVEKQVVMHGTVRGAPGIFEGHVVGIPNVSVLDGFLRLRPVTGDGSRLDVLPRNPDGTGGPAEFRFTGESGIGSYRLMAENVVKSNVKDFTPNERSEAPGISWFPSAQNVEDIAASASTLGNTCDRFQRYLDDDGRLGIGMNGTHSVSMIVAENPSLPDEVPEGNFFWPTDIFVKILRLAMSNETEVIFKPMGLLEISVTTPIAHYRFFIGGSTADSGRWY